MTGKSDEVQDLSVGFARVLASERWVPESSQSISLGAEKADEKEESGPPLGWARYGRTTQSGHDGAKGEERPKDAGVVIGVGYARDNGRAPG